MKLVLVIAAGGGLGAVARYLLAGQVTRLLGSQFPWGILVVNVVGSFAMGVLIELMARFWSASPEARAFLAVGVLGGFTTYSTFSHDAATLDRRGAAVYVIASVALGVAAALAGRNVGNRLA